MQINITCGVGSTGRISEALYHATLENGYDACFAYSAYTPTLKNAFRMETKWQNIWRRGLNRYLGRKQSHSTPGTKRLIRYIQREKPDLIHLHNVQQNSVDYCLLFDFLKRSDIPVVYTLHDCWPFTGGCYHFTQRGCAQYRSGCTACTWTADADDITISPKTAYAYKQEYIGGNDRIHPVCVSHWLCNVATQSYMGKMKHPPRVVHNGIDTSVFYPREVDRPQMCGIDEQALVILGVASYWNEDKGLSLFFEIAKRADFPIRIILIGGGLDAVKARCDERFLCIERTENVHELARYYSLADVFINTSLEETFGLTTAEALACGTPAIVFDSTACPEVIDGYTGICVPYDTDALMEAIAAIREKGKAYYTAHCKERAEKEFSKEKMLERYLEIYGSILNET